MNYQNKMSFKGMKKIIQIGDNPDHCLHHNLMKAKLNGVTSILMLSPEQSVRYRNDDTHFRLSSAFNLIFTASSNIWQSYEIRLKQCGINFEEIVFIYPFEDGGLDEKIATILLKRIVLKNNSVEVFDPHALAQVKDGLPMTENLIYHLPSTNNESSAM